MAAFVAVAVRKCGLWPVDGRARKERTNQRGSKKAAAQECVVEGSCDAAADNGVILSLLVLGSSSNDFLYSSSSSINKPLLSR